MSSMSNLPRTQRALIADSPGGRHEIRDIPVPVPADDELLVRIRYSGICHSDMKAYAGKFEAITKFPLIGGHEGAGEVVAMGELVKNWKVGENAGIKMMNYICMNCEFCKRGYETNCSHIINTGYGTPGTFQEYVTIPAKDAARIPPGANLALIAPILCAGVTAYRAIKEVNVQAGQILAITGAGGGIGSLAIQYAKAMGIKVLAIADKSREAHCSNLGADFFQDCNADDLIHSIQKMTNGGTHAVLCLAPSKKAMEDAVLYARKRATIVFVGLTNGNMVELNSTVIILNCLKIIGTMTGNRQDVDEAIQLVVNGSVKIPIELVRLRDVPNVFERLRKGAINGRAVIDMSLL